MNEKRNTQLDSHPAVLSIAGSDSGGGAGIQADLRVFSSLNTFGTTAITALTAQNLTSVAKISPVEEELIDAQIEAIADGFPIRAVKTGMLFSSKIAEAVARKLRSSRLLENLVVDPVMVATSGARLMDQNALSTYQDLLLPQCRIMTPNIDEASLLGNASIPRARDPMIELALVLSSRHGSAILLKGGHLEGDPIDVLIEPARKNRITTWQHPRVDGVNSHGSGCILSAAIAAFLAKGQELSRAVETALGLVHDALLHPRRLGTIKLPGIESARPERALLHFEKTVL